MSKFNFQNGYFKYFRLLWENILYPGKFKLDFVVVGTQKGGTSSLDGYFRQHSKLAMPRWKELHYFNHERAFKNKTQPRLRGYYRIKNRIKLYGEITPCYMYSETALKRIKEHNPQARIIAILRDPVARAYSHWNMEVWRNAEKRGFRECIEDEIRQISAGEKKIDLVRSYVHRGMYPEQIKRIYDHFPEDQVLLIKYENFMEKQLEVLNQIYDFLGIHKISSIKERQVRNQIDYSKKISEEERKILKEFFQPQILEVENLLAWDCKDWKA